jgi:hypothetical protein
MDILCQLHHEKAERQSQNFFFLCDDNLSRLSMQFTIRFHHHRSDDAQNIHNRNLGSDKKLRI